MSDHLQHAFELYRSDCLDDNLTEDQLAPIEATFFAGAISLWALLRMGATDKEASKERWRELSEELKAYRQAVLKKGGEGHH